MPQNKKFKSFGYSLHGTYPKDYEKKVAAALSLRKNSNTKIAGIKQPTHVPEMDYIMLTGIATSKDLVYRVTKALVAHQKDLGRAFGAFKRNKVVQMGMVKETPYHPGAIRALKEAGIKVSM